LIVRLFGLSITRASRAAAVTAEKAISPVSAWRGGWYTILESFTGAWQRNIKVNRDTVLSNPANFACKTLIASDIAKLRVKLVQQDANGIWTEVQNAAFSPVLRKPNHFQTRIQFWENWILSKLSFGNTCVLKQRDNRNVVTALYVLDWRLVEPMVADDGSVFYQLSADNIAGINETVLVPASEIIHDRYNCLFHPLIGLSPIFANGVAATQALAIQNSSAHFFGNRSMPSGILTASGAISKETAEELKTKWQKNYSGDNAGKVAVLGDGLKFESIATTAVDAQLIEQLRWTAEIVASTYHVPPYKIGVGQMPSYNNIQALNVEYYSQALQRLIEDAELCLDEGLGIGLGSSVNGVTYGTEFDLDNLLRMDSVTQMEVLDKGKNTLTPNEARLRVNLPPVEGGNSVFRQQQDYSLAALAKRDAQSDPFASGRPPAPPAPAPANDDDQAARAMLALFEKNLREALDAA
jgi:HK97 family phage portal protein